MATIGALVYKIQADVADMVANTKVVEQRLASMEAASVKTSAAIGNLSGVIGRYASGAMIGMAIRSSAEFADQMDELATGLGITTDALQELGYAAKQNGADTETMYRALATLEEKIAGGDKSFVAALDKAHLSLATLKSSSPDQAFMLIAEAVRGISDPMERFAVASDLLNDKIAKRMMTVLVSDLRAAREEAPKMSAETVKAMGAANDAFDKVITTGKGLIGTVLAPIVPAFSTVADWAGKAAGAVAELGVQLNAVAFLSKDVATLKDIFTPGTNPALPNSPLKSGGGLPSLSLPSDKEQKELEKRANEAVQWSQFRDAEAGAQRMILDEFISSYNAVRDLSAQHTLELKKQNDALMVQYQLEREIAQEALKLSTADAMKRIGRDEAGYLTPTGREGALYDLEQKRAAELAGIDKERAALIDPKTGKLSSEDSDRLDRKRSAIEEFYDKEYVRLVDSFNGAASAADKASGAIGRLADRISPSSTTTGVTQPGFLGPVGVNRTNLNGAFDWATPGHSAGSPWWGVAGSMEPSWTSDKARYFPTAFSSPGVSGGGVSVTVNQQYPISSDPRGKDQMQTMVEKAIEDALRARGIWV